MPRSYSRVSSWGDEIEAAVDPGVGDALLSGDVDLLLQELLKLLINKLGNRLPAVDKTGHLKQQLGKIKQLL